MKEQQDDPFKAFGGTQIEVDDNPFAEFGGSEVKKKPSPPDLPLGGTTLKNGYDFSQTHSGTKPVILTEKGAIEHEAVQKDLSNRLNKAIGAYAGAQGKDKTVEVLNLPEREQGVIQPMTGRSGNRLTYTYNKFLEGIGGAASGLMDAGIMMATPTEYSEFGDAESKRQMEELLNEYRATGAPAVRSFLKEGIGANVDKGTERKFGEEFVTGAMGGLAYSVPAMLSPYGIGLYTQAYDTGLESINSTEEGRKLSEAQKTLYAGFTGAVIGTLEKTGLERIFGKSGVSKQAVNGLIVKAIEAAKKSDTKLTKEFFEKFITSEVNTLAKKLTRAVPNVAKASVVEGWTGGLQELATIGSERLTNALSDKKVFEPQSLGEMTGRVLKAAGQEAIGGGILGGVKTGMNENVKSDLINKIVQSRTFNSNRDVLMEVERIAQENGYNEQQVAELTDAVNNYEKIVSKIPDTVPDVAKVKIVPIIEERDETVQALEEEKKKEVDVAFQPIQEAKVEILEAKIEDLNKQIVETSETIKEEPKDAIQESSTTESVLRNEGIRGEDQLQPVEQGNEIKVTPEESVTEEAQISEPEERIKEQRKKKREEFNSFKEEVQKLAEKDKGKGGLTGSDAKRYQELTSKMKDIVYELAKPIDVSKLPSEAERESTLSGEIVKIAQEDLLKNKEIYDAISESATGVYFDADTPVDDILNGKSDVSKEELYNAFEPTREALRKEHGNAIKLFRATGKQKKKPTTNWATTESFAKKFGDDVITKEIPIENIVAVNVGVNGKYHEIIVADDVEQFNKPINPESNENETEGQRRQERLLTEQGQQDVAPSESPEYANEREELRDFVSKETDPQKIAERYHTQVSEPDFVESGIMDYMGNSKVNLSDYTRWGDRNNLTPAIKRRWIDSDNKKMDLDVSAQELSNKLGVEVTPEDIIETITRYPSRKEFDEHNLGYEKRALAEKYYELTGKNLTDKIAERAYNKIKNAPKTDEELYKLNVDLQERGITYEEIKQYLEYEQEQRSPETPVRKPKSDGGGREEVGEQREGVQEKADAKIAEAERTVKAKEQAVKTVEQQYEKLSKSLNENLKENQASIFENKTQSLFDDKANQSKIVSDKKAELESAKKELVKAQEDLQRISDSKNQLEIEEKPTEKEIESIYHFKQSINTAKRLFGYFDNTSESGQKALSNAVKEFTKAVEVAKEQLDELSDNDSESAIKKKSELSDFIELTQKGLDRYKSETKTTIEEKPIVEKASLQSAKEKLKEAKKRLDDLNKNLGIASDPKKKAEAFYDYHKALVSVAKEYIKEGIQDVQAFAKELGEKVTKVLEDAWNEATGGKGKTLDDFEDIDTVTQQELNTLGITIEQTRLLREQLGEEQYEYERKRRATLVKEAQQLMSEGYSVPNLIKRIDKGYIPKDAEIELIRQYFVSLTARINNAPTTELLAERKQIMETLDLLKTRAGRTVQAFDGLIAIEDNLAAFLQDEGKYYELSPEEVKELTDKYNKAKEALEKLQAKEAEAIERERNKLAQKKINEIRSQKRALVKEDFKKERTILVESIREKLKQIRNTPSATILPYARELIAIAPEVRKLVQSHIDEKIYDLKEIIKSIHSDLKDDIEGLTENDIRDIIAGQYPNPRNTKNAKLAQIRDLETQARLERKIELLEQGIMETKNPSVRKAKSDAVEALEKQIKEIKKRNPDLTAPSKLQSRKTWYGNKIKELKGQISKGEYDPVEPPHPVILDAEALKLKDEYAGFIEETRKRRANKEHQSLSRWQKIWHLAYQAFGLKRLVQTSIDLSIPLRQGRAIMFNTGIPVFRDGKWQLTGTSAIGVKGYGKMLSMVFDEKKYHRMMHDIRSDPKYLESKDDGIVYTETSSPDPELRDESHPSENFIYKIPYANAPVRASERAAAAWTNFARFELYKRQVKILESKGKTRENAKKAYEQAAARVMVDTGRGKIPILKDKSPSETDTAIKRLLGDVFYGARLYSATFRKLNPLYYLNPNVDKTVRIAALQDMTGYVVDQVLLHTALAAALGATVSFDWDDPDFFKLRKGKWVLDLGGGESVYIRTYMRVLNACLKWADPSVSHKDAENYAEFAKQSVGTFWRNKLAPNKAYVYNFFSGQNSIGEKFDPYEIIRIYPMYTEDVVKSLKEGSPLDAAIVLGVGISGLGYQEYSKDIRRARISTYLEPKDRELKSFLKKHQLNIQGDINQEVYNLEAGAKAKMTKEESDRYEKIWSDYIITGLKDKMPELDKMKEDDFVKEVSKIKTQATKYAKEQITGINQEFLGEIKDDDKKEWKLSPEQVKEAAEIYHKFIKQHENEIEQNAKEAVEYDEPKPTLLEARRRAERALKSEAVSEAKYQITQKPDFKKKAIPAE